MVSGFTLLCFIISGCRIFSTFPHFNEHEFLSLLDVFFRQLITAPRFIYALLCAYILLVFSHHNKHDFLKFHGSLFLFKDVFILCYNIINLTRNCAYTSVNNILQY